MTKIERRKEALERHYRALEALSAIHGVKVDGKKLSTKLLKLEREAHKNAEDYCNGVVDSDRYDELSDATEKAVDKLMGFELAGFFVNGDPRGCALKIQSEVMLDMYHATGLERDWGGYGLLSPDIQ